MLSNIVTVRSPMDGLACLLPPPECLLAVTVDPFALSFFLLHHFDHPAALALDHLALALVSASALNADFAMASSTGSFSSRRDISEFLLLYDFMIRKKLNGGRNARTWVECEKNKKMVCA